MPLITPNGVSQVKPIRCLAGAVIGNMNDDAEIRRANLRSLKLDPTELVKRAGRSYSYWRDLLTGNKSFGEKAARAIEVDLDLPRGWLDAVAVRGDQPPLGLLNTPPVSQQLLDDAQAKVDAQQAADLKAALPALVAALARLTPGQWKMVRARLDDAPGASTEAVAELISDVGPMLGVHVKETPKPFPNPPLPADAQAQAARPGRPETKRDGAPTAEGGGLLR